VHAQVHWNRLGKLTRRLFLPVVGVCSTLACDASDDETVWAQYLAWLKGRVVGDLVGLDTYRKVPFVMDVVKGLKPGTALDVCMGEGRNSIFLAGMRWKVTGFDVSDLAVANAVARAKSGSGDNSSSIRISGLQLRPREMGPDCDDVRLFPHPRHEICKPAH